MTAASPILKNEPQGSFTQLLQQHRKIVYKIAYSYAWHPDDRAELTQEISTQLWLAFPKYDNSRSFSTWMYRVALNVAISFLRANKRYQQHIVVGDAGIDQWSGEDHKDASLDQDIGNLYRVINSFDPMNRALLLLHLEDRSTREIADILGIKQSNVTTKLNRLREKLRTQLNNQGEE